MTRMRIAGFALNLALAMAASTFISFAFGALGPVLREDLGLSRAELGFVVTAYLATGGLFSPLVGRPIRSLGSRRGLLVLYAYSLFGYVIVALAPSFVWILITVAVAGISGAGSNPLTNHVIASHGEPGSRGVLLGVKQSGVQFGAVIAGSVLPSIAIWQGWRAALIAASAMPLLGIVLTTKVVGDEPSLEVAGRPHGPRLREMVRSHPFLLWLTGYAVLMGGAMSATNVYLPLYAFERLSFSVQLAGLLASAIGFVGVPARIVWGRTVEARQHALATDLAAVAVASAVSAVLLLIAGAVGSWSLWIAAAGFGGFTSAWNVVAMMATIRDLPREDSAAGTGVVQLGFYIGLMSGPSLFGLVLGEAGRYSLAWTGVATTFALAALLVIMWRRFSRGESGRPLASRTQP